LELWNLLALGYRNMLLKRGPKRTSRADFIHRLSADFFKDRAREILRSLDRKDLQFDPGTGKFTAGSEEFDAYDLDDLVLGPLESVALLEERGIVDASMVADFFGWYVVMIWENPVVQEYLEWQVKQPEGWEVYAALAQLYRKCTAIRARRKSTNQ
jgi:hypothetical protein